LLERVRVGGASKVTFGVEEDCEEREAQGYIWGRGFTSQTATAEAPE